MPFTLIEIEPHAFVLSPLETSYGMSNIGVLVEDGAATLIDTGATPRHAFEANKQLLETHDVYIKRVIVTSSKVAFTGGSQVFWKASFYGSQLTSEALDIAPSLEAFKKLLPAFTDDYTAEDFAPRPVTHTISEHVAVTRFAAAQPFAGDTSNNLLVTTDTIAFLGSSTSFGVTPLGFQANFDQWVESLQTLHASDIEQFIPGHGTPGSKRDLEQFIAYLQACQQANGDVSQLAAGPWDTWANKEFDAINVERAHAMSQGIDTIGDAMYTLLGIDQR